MKPSRVIREKNETDGPGAAANRQFHFLSQHTLDGFNILSTDKS